MTLPTIPKKKFGSGGAIFANGAGGAASLGGPPVAPSRKTQGFFDKGFGKFLKTVTSPIVKTAIPLFAPSLTPLTMMFEKGGSVKSKKLSCPVEKRSFRKSTKTEDFRNHFK